MKMDLVITWPISCDFPIWRRFLRENRNLFENVIIVMSDTHTGHDYSDFLFEATKKDGVMFRRKDSYIQMEDWRNAAVNAGLTYATSEWVFFTEQDFFIYDPKDFFDRMDKQSADVDIFHHLEGERIHPACMVVRKDMINKTKKDFSVDPGKSDHFGKFVDELSDKKARFKVLPGKNGDDYLHLNGLTHNYRLIEDGKIRDIYQPGLFQLYNSYARIAPVERDDHFVQLSFKVDMRLSPMVKILMGKAK